MARTIDFATASRKMVPSDYEEVRQELKAKYLDNGWDLFNTHYVGIVGPELHMVYVFVKYEQEPPVPSVTLQEWHEGDPVAPAPRKRGRPAKVADQGNGYGKVESVVAE